MSGFRKSLIQASEQACKDGAITKAELFKIRLVSLRPNALVRMQTAMEEHVVAEGIVSSSDAVSAIDWSKIDWSKMFEFIKMIISLFA